MLEERLPGGARGWLERSTREIARGIPDPRFGELISLASRHAPRGALSPSGEERARAGELLEGWDPERWTLLETLRAALVLARPDLAEEGIGAALEEAFAFADVGELCALYRTLAHLPEPGRFAARAGLGARSNMRSVFEATCCDTPYPARWFDGVAWRQAVIKCLFVEAPLWRVWGLDRRLDAELARMALDLADERRSAGRRVQPEICLCLGGVAGGRGREWLERLLTEGDREQRGGAALGLARAGETDRLRRAAAAEPDPLVRTVMTAALEGRYDQAVFRPLDPAAQGGP